MISPDDNSKAHKPDINPDKRSPNPALAVKGSDSYICQTEPLLSEIILLAPFNKRSNLN